MKAKQALEQELAKVIREQGEYIFDIPLPNGVWTRGKQDIPHTRLRRIVQIIEDVSRKPISKCRILDLGCADGLYSIEFALRGARVTGIDVREANIKRADFCKDALELGNLEFIQEDVRSISPKSLGVFDVVLCSGILYHLPEKDIFRFIETMHAMSTGLVIIDTHISLAPTVSVRYGGSEYKGDFVHEYIGNPSQQEIIKNPLISIDREPSFWFSRPSLMNILSRAGFSSVFECLNPAHINFGKPGLEHTNRCTFVAVKGKRAEICVSPHVNKLEEKWPEDSLSYAASQFTAKKAGGPGRLLKLSVLSLVSALLAFVIFEGSCSLILVLRSFHRPVAERMHTQYDEQLGWKNIPNRYIKDMYGKGVYLRTNSQGFRNNADFTASVPDGRIRIVCSGDSFTLGYGVDNDHTWCQLLASLDPRLETVNMGQGGYGLDQAYLWYKRDGVKFQHQIHVLALIADDFYRSGAYFLGYSKPYFKLRDDSLVLRNVPVPKRAFYVPFITENIDAFSDLRSMWFFRVIKDRPLAVSDKLSVVDQRVADERAIALKLFECLARVNKEQRSMFVVVYLPTAQDLKGDNGQNSGIREFLAAELSKRGLLFMDLTDDFKKLPDSEKSCMFGNDAHKYPYSQGHYNEKGNKFVAQALYKWLSPYLVPQ